MKGQDEGGALFRERQGRTEGGGDRLVGDGAKPLQKTAIAAESGAQSVAKAKT